MTFNPTRALSGNVLKLIAAISMLIDHIGLLLLPQIPILRVIGRLAFPIFSFMIYEGCRHTRNKTRYFLQVFSLGTVTTAVYCILVQKLYFNVLITFSVSILLIYMLQSIPKIMSQTVKIFACGFFGVTVLSIYYISSIVTFDYNFWGIMLPLFPAAVDLFYNKQKRILLFNLQFISFAAGLAIMSLANGKVITLIALFPLAFYDGRKGFKLPKYSFYVFYPLHLVVLYSLKYLVQ